MRFVASVLLLFVGVPLLFFGLLMNWLTLGLVNPFAAAFLVWKPLARLAGMDGLLTVIDAVEKKYGMK